MKSIEPSSFIGVTMATMLPLNIFMNIPYVVARGHTFKIVLINTARGIAKKTPQIPHTDPKNNIDNSIANGWIFTASENRIGTTTFPSIACINK